MNNFIIRQRVKLIHMNDPFPVPAGTLGTIEFIDDDYQIHVAWDNGSHLALIVGIDKFTVVNKNEYLSKSLDLYLSKSD